MVLKRDLLSTIERGRFVTPAGEVEAVLRRIDEVPWWCLGLARHLFARERRALAVAGELGIAPPLLFAGHNALIRGWMDGLPLHIAKPHGARAAPGCSVSPPMRICGTCSSTSGAMPPMLSRPPNGACSRRRAC